MQWTFSKLVFLIAIGVGITGTFISNELEASAVLILACAVVIWMVENAGKEG